MAGRQIECPDCGFDVRVPTEQILVERTGRPRRSIDEALDDATEGMGGRRRSRPPVPNYGERSGRRICARCGQREVRNTTPYCHKCRDEGLWW